MNVENPFALAWTEASDSGRDTLIRLPAGAAAVRLQAAMTATAMMARQTIAQ
jgi:hypothetical protein